MKLYIQIRDGQPYEHPIVEWNFIQAFPDIDVNNLPPEYCPFVRVEAPVLGPYEKNQTVSYGLVDMTAEEILAKQNAVKATFAEMRPTWASWTFDEDTCAMVPPVPDPSIPSSNVFYEWNEDALAWDAAHIVEDE